MNAPGPRRIVTACVLALAAAACSNHGSPNNTPGSRASAGASASLVSACKGKLLTADDVAGVLRGPSTAEEIPGDRGSTCRFTTADYASVSVTLRPGVGKASLAIWKSGRMPVSGVVEPGVGDEAVWVEGLHEMVAQKNDLLCDIQVSGLVGQHPGRPDADQRRRVGALCNKIFAATP